VLKDRTNRRKFGYLEAKTELLTEHFGFCLFGLGSCLFGSVFGPRLIMPSPVCVCVLVELGIRFLGSFEIFVPGNRNRSVLFQMLESMNFGFGYFGSVPVLTEGTKIFQDA